MDDAEDVRPGRRHDDRRLEVVWPGGATSRVEEGLGINSLVEIVEPAG